MLRFARTVLVSVALVIGPAVPAALAEPPDPADFLALARATTAEEAAAPEARILAAWRRSGSDTADLFLAWADEAAAAQDFSRALDLLDMVVAVQPDFAEGFNRRATIRFLQEDYGASLSDIERVLALEPRHFGALSGLGQILRVLGDDRRARDVYARALAIHPQLTGVREELEAIGVATDGQPI